MANWLLCGSFFGTHTHSLPLPNWYRLCDALISPCCRLCLPFSSSSSSPFPKNVSAMETIIIMTSAIIIKPSIDTSVCMCKGTSVHWFDLTLYSFDDNTTTYGRLHLIMANVRWPQPIIVEQGGPIEANLPNGLTPTESSVYSRTIRSELAQSSLIDPFHSFLCQVKVPYTIFFTLLPDQS